jgi:N-carbamoylputrescine amidase
MNTPKQFRVGLVQMAVGPDPDANLNKAVERIHEAALLGAHIICLPELFRTQYFCQRKDLRLFDLACLRALPRRRIEDEADGLVN